MLVGYDATAGSSPYDALDVERVFSAVELLAERHTLEVSPFVSVWHPAVDIWDHPRFPGRFDSKLEAPLSRGEDTQARDVIAKLVEAVTARGTREAYKRLARRMVATLKSLLRTEFADVRYLRPLAVAAELTGGLTVATLNYDLTVEQLATATGVPVETGLDE